MKGLLATLAAGLLFLAACGGAQPIGAATGGRVTATLTDTGIILDQKSVTSGEVTFVVKNEGTLLHELVVVKTDLAPDKLPADADEPGKVSEEGSQGESGDLNAGETKEFKLNLDPGKYVLMCNEPGHYLMGMHVALLVK